MLCFPGQCNKEAEALKLLAPAQCMVDPADLFPFCFIEIDEDANYALSFEKLEVYIYLLNEKASLFRAVIPYLKPVRLFSTLFSTVSKLKETVRLTVTMVNQY